MSMSSSSLETQWKVEMVLRAAGLASLMATSWFLARKILPLLESATDNEDNKNKTGTGMKILKQLGINPQTNLTDYELVIAAQLVLPETKKCQNTWDDIGGLDEILLDVKRKMINPLLHSDVFKHSRLASAPKGALFYGPPGCGKTMIARGIASQSGFRFINLQMSFLLNKWYGESQKYTAAIFSLARKLQPSVIFIDEIDSFLRNRDSTDHEATAMMKAEVMALWDGLTTDSSAQIILIGATNRPNDIDPAVLRRMPLKFHIPLPTADQRSLIFRKILKNEIISDSIDYNQLGKLSEGLSGSEIKEVCRQAVIKQMNLTIENGNEALGPVTFDDLVSELNCSNSCLSVIEDEDLE